MISFVETMRGEVDDGERRRKIEFTVRADGLGGGHFTLKGVATVDGLTEESEAKGTLEISVLPPRIRYQLELDTRKGRLTLDAEKHPSPLSPFRSMSWMPVTLRDPGGKVVAKGEMVFDFRELPEFAVSWLPLMRQQKAIDARRRASARKLIDQES
ncbi:MAG: hypothetical protein QM723_22775 [Myxococcaceae bacterium]